MNNHVPKWIPILLILLVIGAFALALLFPTSGNAEEFEEEVYYGVLLDDSDQYELNYDHELVKQIQTVLNKFLKKNKKSELPVDGIYGPNTAQAVKYYQQKNKLTIDGICGPETLGKMKIDDSNVDVYPMWIPNLWESFSKSKTGLALHLNLKSHKLEVWRYVDGEWRLIRVMLAATGNYKKGLFTDLADLNIGETKHKYISGTNSDGTKWRGWFALGIQRGDFFHSILQLGKNGKWWWSDNSALGKDVTHGCVRLSRENAEWLQNIVEPGTRCVIDDRAWDFDLTN